MELTLGTLMRACRYLALFLGLIVWPSVCLAQMTPEDVERVGERDKAVTDALAWKRLQTEVIYLRPSAPFKPDEQVRIEVPEPPESPQETTRAAKWTWGTVFLIVLIVIVVVFIMQGNRINVSFRATHDRKRADSEPARDTPILQDIPLDGFLDRIARMQDRREALILLVSRALEQAAHANNMTLGRAQTARDVVRVIPRRWSHREALNKLVREAEVVHFGGRDISEDRWRDCLDRARPIFGTVARA